MNDLKYWKALTCFGDDQVRCVLQDTQWRENFPKVFGRLESTDDRVRNDTMIPWDAKLISKIPTWNGRLAISTSDRLRRQQYMYDHQSRPHRV